MSGVLAYLLLLVGLITGATRPRLGLSILVAGVAVTPTLPWQLGLFNLAYPLAFALGLVVGAAAGGVAVARPARQKDGRPIVGWLVVAVLATTVVPTLRALVVNGPVGTEAFAPEAAAALTSLAAFNPDRLGGVLQVLAIAVVGLLVFNLARQLLDSNDARRGFERALVFGAGVAVSAPLVQLAALDPTVRPDKGIDEAAGWVGWFQDPHSYAAYLVLVGPLLFGIAAARRTRGEALAAWGVPAALGAATFLPVVMTSSRAGLASWLGALGLFAIGAWVFASEGTHESLRRRTNAAVLAVVALGAFLLAVWVAPPLRAPIHSVLTSAGNERLAELFGPEGPESPLLGRRLLLWRKGTTLLARHPLWGTGAQGFIDTAVELPDDVTRRYADAYGDEELRLALLEYPVEQAHNYFLQYAVEYGLPGLAALLALLASIAGHAAQRRRNWSTARRQSALGAGAGLAGIVVFSTVSHPLLLAEINLMFWALAAYLVCAGAAREAQAN